MVYDSTIAPPWNEIVSKDIQPEPAKLFHEIAAYQIFIILQNDSDLDRTEWQVTCSAFIAIILILIVIRKSIGFNICLITYHYYSFIYLFATGSIAPPSTYKNNRCSRLVEKMDNLERLANNKAKQSVCPLFWKKKTTAASGPLGPPAIFSDNIVYTIIISIYFQINIKTSWAPKY